MGCVKVTTTLQFPLDMEKEADIFIKIQNEKQYKKLVEEDKNRILVYFTENYDIEKEDEVEE